jgi:hypothetical protein
MQVTSTVEVPVTPSAQLVERFTLEHRRVFKSQDQLAGRMPQLPQHVWNPLEHRLSFGMVAPVIQSALNTKHA